MIFDSMIFLARRRRISPPPPAPVIGRHAAPDPLTDPGIPITETAVFGHLLSESPVREFKMKTARASNFRFPVRCVQCHGEHVNTNADTFHDLYASARNAGWQEDRFRAWRCPRCAKRYKAALGVPPVAAIEGGTA